MLTMYLRHPLLQKKKTNPWGIQEVPYEKQLVYFVDSLIKLAKLNGSKTQVETSFDWQTLDYIFKGWQVLYPITSKEFIEHMKNWRKEANNFGITREKGGAMMQHKFNLPRPLYSMIKTIFPKQQWDKQFVNKFANHFDALRGSNKI